MDNDNMSNDFDDEFSDDFSDTGSDRASKRFGDLGPAHESADDFFEPKPIPQTIVSAPVVENHEPEPQPEPQPVTAEPEPTPQSAFSEFIHEPEPQPEPVILNSRRIIEPVVLNREPDPEPVAVEPEPAPEFPSTEMPEEPKPIDVEPQPEPEFPSVEMPEEPKPMDVEPQTEFPSMEMPEEPKNVEPQTATEPQQAGMPRSGMDFGPASDNNQTITSDIINKPAKKKKKMLVIALCIIIGLLLLCCGGAAALLIWGENAVSPNTTVTTPFTPAITNAPTPIPYVPTGQSNNFTLPDIFNGGAKPSSTVDNQIRNNSEASAKFDALVNDYCRYYLSDNLVNLHFTVGTPASYGIDSYNQTLGRYTYAGFTEDIEKSKELMTQLKTIDYDMLSNDRQLSYDIIEYYSQFDEPSYFYIYEFEPLSGTTGIHVQLPTVLSEYKFDNANDVTDYFKLIDSVPEYFTEVLTFEQEKATATDFFMSDAAIDHVAEACEDICSVDPAESYLCTSFAKRLESLSDISDADKATYIAQNEQMVRETIYPAYENLKKGMLALKGSAAEQNMPHVSIGYYEYLIGTNVGSDRNLNDVYNLFQRYANLDTQDLLQHYTDKAANLMESNAGPQLTDPEEILKDLRAKMVNEFPYFVSEVPYQVTAVPKEMENVSSPAYYMIPRLNANDVNAIYVNYSQNFENNSYSLYTTLAHEGFPGHLYQTNYFRQQGGDNPFRTIFSSTGYVEGWASYVEFLSYLWPDDLDEDYKILMSRNASATIEYYGMMDIGINYNYWDLDEFAAFVRSTFGPDVDDATIGEMYDRIIEEPGNYMNYALGYLEIRMMEEDYLRTYPNSNVQDFRTKLLTYGPAPFPVLRKYLGLGK